MLSLAASAEILRVPISPDLVLDERAITSALDANAAQGHGMPEPAVFEVMGAGFGLLAVFAWPRHAISRIHRPGYIRKRRYEHPMAWI